MKIDQAGIDFIKHYEGVRLVAYLCSAGVSTIGVGHTKGVKMGDTCNMEQVDKFLLEDLEACEKAIRDFVSVPLTQGQHNALCSFIFNLGSGAFRGSTLLKMLNKGQYQVAADQLLRWNQAGGRVLIGLVKRRNAERSMFLSS